MRKHMAIAEVVALALLCAPNAIGQTATGRASTDASLRVILLGSGVGPPVNLTQFGASTLVEAGGQRLLFDCGRGATIRLVDHIQRSEDATAVERVAHEVESPNGIHHRLHQQWLSH